MIDPIESLHKHIQFASGNQRRDIIPFPRSDALGKRDNVLLMHLHKNEIDHLHQNVHALIPRQGTAIYAVIGFAGYLTYGENVEGNILNNYPQTTTIGILRVALSFAITFSYPLVSYPARECFSTLLFGKSPDELKWYTYYGITYVMAVGSVVAAIIADDLELVLGLLGSTGAVAITFVMPGLFYYYLGDHPVLRKSKWHEFKRKSAVCLVVFGIVMAVVGVALQFDG